MRLEIIRIDNHEEPPLIHIRLPGGKTAIYSIDDIEIEGDTISIKTADFCRDKNVTTALPDLREDKEEKEEPIEKGKWYE